MLKFKSWTTFTKIGWVPDSDWTTFLSAKSGSTAQTSRLSLPSDKPETCR